MGETVMQLPDSQESVVQPYEETNKKSERGILINEMRKYLEEQKSRDVSFFCLSIEMSELMNKLGDRKKGTGLEVDDRK